MLTQLPHIEALNPQECTGIHAWTLVWCHVRIDRGAAAAREASFRQGGEPPATLAAVEKPPAGGDNVDERVHCASAATAARCHRVRLVRHDVHALLGHAKGGSEPGSQGQA